jgi:N-acetylneuraminic acid mutarotase
MGPRPIPIELRRRPLLLFVASFAVLAAVVASPSASAAPDSTSGVSFPNTWVPTGPMSGARTGQTATLLPNGNVLIAGGGTAKAELYDPASGSFTTTGTMAAAREDATATLLPDGDVLVAGGSRGSVQLNSAELYDPTRGTWALTGQMSVARSGQTATLLADGDVLVAGGGCNGQAYGCDAGSFLSTLKSAELYDPATGAWSATSSMKEGRQFFTATLLPDGKVLVAGGFNDCDDDFCSDLASAELYDPVTGKWTDAGTFHGPREQQTATLLGDGDVLMSGGLNEGGDGAPRSYAEAEIYDPSAGTWTETGPLPAPHYGQTATLLPNGWVLVAGGQSAAAEVYEPSSGIWVLTGAMSTPRTDHTATLLPDARVLVTGGTGPDGQAQSTAELYQTGRGPLVTLSPTPLGFGAQQVGTAGTAQSYTVANHGSGNLVVSGVTISGANPGDFTARSGCAAVVPAGGNCAVYVRFAPTNIGLRTAKVAVVDNAPLSPQAVPVNGYGAGPNAWAPTGSMTTARQHFTATLLPDGDVLVAGGENGFETYLASAELYDPTTGTFTPTGSLHQARAYATATLLPDGEVLVAGGLGTGPVALSSAELYDPMTGTWTLTGAMNQASYNLSSVLLPNGNVLLEGFVTGIGAELYDPTTGTWTNTGPLGTPGYFDTATLLTNGDVLAAGGDSTAADLYDPATNDWAPTGPMAATQEGPTATLLPTGQVLVVGGEAPNDEPMATSELYDPTKGTWTLTLEPMTVARFGQTATLLTDGEVLVTGGCITECDSRNVTATTEVYDPSGGYWFNGEPMVQARYAHTSTLLASGNVLVAGGSNYCCQNYTSAELYTPTLMIADPTSGSVGQQVVLSGSGYFAHETVKVTWDGGVTRLASARTSNQGTFSADITVPTTRPGEHQIDAEGSRSFANAEVTFHVTRSP